MLIYAFTTPFVLLVGFIANCLCLIVFRAKRLRSTTTGCSCATILTALAAADLLVLFCYIGPEWIQKGLPQLIKLYQNPTLVTSYRCKGTQCHLTSENYVLLPVLLKPGIHQIYIFIIYVLRMFSVWLLVLFTIERYVGVCYPLRRNLFRNRHKVLQAVWVLLTASIVICIYKPILSSDSDIYSNLPSNRYPQQHHSLPFNRTSLLQQSIHTKINQMTDNLSQSIIIPDHSQIDLSEISSNLRRRTKKNTRIIFILDSCYAFTLTVVPFLVILGLNLRILVYLLKHDNNWLMNTGSNRSLKQTSFNNNFNNDPHKNRNSKSKHTRRSCISRILRLRSSNNGQWNFPKPHLSFKTNTFPRTIHDNNVIIGSNSWSSGTYCQSIPSGMNDNNQFTGIQNRNDLSQHRVQVSCWCRSCSKSRATSLNPTPILIKPPIRHADRLGRQFVITLLTVSACFLILNIPYLIVWICRWLEDSMVIYYDHPTNVLSDQKSDSPSDLNISVDPSNHGDEDDGDVTRLYMSIVQSLLNEMRNLTLNNSSSNNLDMRKSDLTDFSPYSYASSWIAISLPISRTVFSFNYCINFFLYSLVGKYFRRELKRIFSNWSYMFYARCCPTRARKVDRVRQPLPNMKHYNYKFRMERRLRPECAENMKTSQTHNIKCDYNRSYGSGQDENG